MKRFISVLLISLLMLAAGNSFSSAATVSNKTLAIKAFTNIQKLINSTSKTLKNLDQVKEEALTDLEDEYLDKANVLRTKFLGDKNLSAANVKTSLDSINRLSKYVVMADNLSRCNGLCAKGAILEFPFNVNDEAAQRGIDSNVESGHLMPQNKTAYEAARREYQKVLDEDLRIISVYQQAVKDQNDAKFQDKYLLEEQFDDKRIILKEALTFQKLVLLCAKRATLSESNYEKSFKVSFSFERNLHYVYKVANLSFSEIDSILTAKTVASALEIYEEGSEISDRYSTAKADSYNKSFKGAVTSGKTFSKEYSKALSLYRANAK